MTESSQTPSPPSKSFPEIYVLASGEKIRAATALELVEYLKQGTFDSRKETLEQYMFRFSERCLFSLQRIVRIDTPENFVADLRKIGVIQNILQAN